MGRPCAGKGDKDDQVQSNNQNATRDVQILRIVSIHLGGNDGCCSKICRSWQGYISEGGKMNLALYMSPETLALRRRQNQWDTLLIKINDILLDVEYEPDVCEILKYIQSSLLKRKEFIEERSNEHKNIEQICRVLDALLTFDINCRNDGMLERAEKLENLKIEIAKVKVTT